MKVPKDIIFRQIGRKIAYYRKLRKLTQEELAEIAYMSQSTLGRIERGCYNHNIPMSVLIDIADALGIDFSLLITFDEKEKAIWWNDKDCT